MSGELKVDIISPNTVGQDIQIDGNLNADTITANNDMNVQGTLNVEGNITGTFDLFFPVGTVMPFDKSFPNLPALSGPFVECDGQFINDSDSPLNGYRTRNLNGAEVSMDLIWEANTGGSRATVSEYEITALSVGDDVSGIGIADGTYISEITGTTVVITDTTVNNTVATVFTNNGEFLRGGLSSGIGQKDAFQGHWHEQYIRLYPTFEGGGGGDLDRLDSTASYTERHDSTTGIRNPKNDGVNSDPRTANETRPVNRSMVYIMRIK